MPVYDYAHEACNYEAEEYVPLLSSPNPACGVCGAPTEKVWRSRRQHHGGLHGWPMRSRMIGGKLREYANPKEFAKAADAAGYRVRDDASWAEEDYGTPIYNWKTGRTEYPEHHRARGMKGQWI